MKKFKNKNFIQGVFAGIICTLVVCAVVTVTTGGVIGNTAHLDKETSKKLSAINSLIDEKYLYEKDIDEEALQQGILKGYVEALGDPYSEYYDKEEYTELTQSTEGKFYGIGAAFSIENQGGYLEVIKVYEDMPADKAGIKAGDKLIKVNGESIEDKTAEAVVTMVKGKEGTKVKLTFMRGDDQYTTTCTRAEVKVPTVSYEMKANKIGYIAISEFTAETYTQFDEAFKALKKQGMSGMVIDLRSNLGGRVDTTCQILDELLPEGTLVYTKDQNGKKTIVAESDEDTKWEKPIAVLVNEYSASASELFTGALQDYDAATVVGTTTFGKGVMQQMFEFKDGTGIKLTIAKYFTPKGQDVNHKGITPDIKVEDTRQSVEDTNDAQLNKALEVVQKNN